MKRAQGTKKDKGTASTGATRTAAAAPGRGFDEVLGNGRIKKILRLALEKGRVPNSLIFCGPKGVGKRRLAVLLAQAINCERGGVEPCLECPTCLRIAEGRQPDVWEVEPDGQCIRIEQMQEVRQAAYVRPLAARRRVFVVADADKMTTDAANCMLKILEEPPSYSHLILVTSMPHLLLPTIKSRCQALAFAPVGREEIVKALAATDCPADRAGVIALLVDGNLEEAMALDWEEVKAVRQEAWDLFTALQGQGETTAFLRNYAFAKRDEVRNAMERVLRLTATFCRDAILLRSGGDPSLLLNPDRAGELAGLGARWDTDEYTRCLDRIERAIAGLKKSLNMSLLVSSVYRQMGDESHG